MFVFNFPAYETQQKRLNILESALRYPNTTAVVCHLRGKHSAQNKRVIKPFILRLNFGCLWSSAALENSSNPVFFVRFQKQVKIVPIV